MKQENEAILNELKELVSKLEDQRADFWDEDEHEWMWNGETLFPYEDLLLFHSFGWVFDEEVYIKSIYIEEDKLYFDANWVSLWSDTGNGHDDKEIDHIEPELALEKIGNEDDFIEVIEHFIEILKGENL